MHHAEKGEPVVSDMDLDDLQTVADYHVSKRAQESGVKKQTQEHIFDLQKEKQRIMDRLKAQLRRVDDPEAPEASDDPEAMEAYYHESKHCYLVKDKRGCMHEVSLGEMVADLNWGLSYRLDARAPRRDRKTYAIAQAKEALMHRLDKQICLEERERKDHAEQIFGGAYTPFIQKLEGREFHESALVGWWAEEMVCGFFTQLIVDGAVDMEIRKADVYQDINQKMDFYVRRRAHTRGVDTQVEKKGVGIQFTLVHNKEKLEKKKQQVERAKKQLGQVRLDDLILVHISIGNKIMHAMREWQKAGEPPGGPMRFWSKETKQAVVQGVLQNLFSEEEIAKIQQAFKSEGSPSSTKAKKRLKKYTDEQIQEASAYLPPDLQSDTVVLKEAITTIALMKAQLGPEHPHIKERLEKAMARFIRRQQTAP